jgi:hypothetical protein
MSLIKKLLLPVCAILICFQDPTYATENTVDTERKNIEAVIEAFSDSIINKDKPTFVSLFHHTTVPWLGSASDKTVGLAPPVKEGQPQRTKVHSSDYISFIDWIVSTPKVLEEKFWDVRILHDTDIASVHFKYSFHQDNIKTNWGEEAWHLVRTEDGWKIASVIYSIDIQS